MNTEEDDMLMSGQDKYREYDETKDFLDAWSEIEALADAPDDRPDDRERWGLVRVFDWHLYRFLESRKGIGTVATRPPRLANEGQLARARAVVQSVASTMSRSGGLYLFIEPDFTSYVRYLHVIRKEPQLRLKSVGFARAYAHEAATIVLQAEGRDSTRDMRSSLPLTLAPCPFADVGSKAERAWFRSIVKRALSCEKDQAQLMDPLADDGAVVDAAAYLFEKVYGRERRPQEVEKAQALGNYVIASNPVQEAE